MNPSFVTLGRAEPSLPVEIVLDLLERPLAHKQPGEGADHHPGHLGTDRIRAVLKPIDQLLELPATVRTASPAGIERRGHRLDVLDVASNRLLFGPYFVEAPVDATGPATESRLREPPWFSSRLCRIDSRTSSQARALPKPGGGSGPPWSSLRMPRTAAQSSSTTAPAGSVGDAGDSTGSMITAVVAAASAPVAASELAPPRRFSTAWSIFRRPRTFLRSGTLVGRSASSTGWATSRRKGFGPERCGPPGDSAAMPVTSASCRPDNPSATGLPRASAHPLAWAMSRRTASAVAEINASANQTRLPVSSRTT